MAILLPLSFIPFLMLGFVVSRRVSRSPRAWTVLLEGLPLAVAFMLITIGGLGRINHHFIHSIFLGSATCALLTLVVQRFWNSGLSPLRWRFGITKADIPLLVLLTVVTSLVSAVIFKYAIYDEMRMQGHITVVESILRGSFPPSYTAFPDVSYRYHYGFNLLSAYFSSAFSLPGYLGMDVASLMSWLMLVPLLILLLHRLGVPRVTLGLGFALVTLTGGLGWLLSRNDPGMGAVYQLPHWQQMFVMNRGIHPHFMMYFFQHPMGLGVGLFLGALVFLQRYFQRPSWSGLWVCACLVGALSLAQVMLFATLLASLGLVFAFRLFQKEFGWPATLMQGLALGVGAVGIAVLLGGFFQFSSGLENQPIQLSWPPSYLRYEYWGGRKPITWVQSLVWYFSGFGWPLLLIPAAWIFSLRKGRNEVRLLAVFCGLCFLVPLFFRYSYSWDIIKWYFGFEFSGKILAAWAFLPWVAGRVWRQVLAWGLVLFGAVAPLRFIGDLALKSQDQFTRSELRIAGFRQPVLTGTFAQLIEELKIAPSGSVWSSPGLSEKVSQFSGRPSLQMDRNTVMMPVSRARIEQRKKDLQTLETAPTLPLLRDLGARWVIYSCGELPRLAPPVQAFLQELRGRADVEFREWGSGSPDCYQTFRLK